MRGRGPTEGGGASVLSISHRMYRNFQIKATNESVTFHSNKQTAVNASCVCPCCVQGHLFPTTPVCLCCIQGHLFPTTRVCPCCVQGHLFPTICVCPCCIHGHLFPTTRVCLCCIQGHQFMKMIHKLFKFKLDVF